ncbi:MAG TPA: hypothetical protein VIM11_22460 [Tepidisphaeraceae bacterium]|jgi:hypothetical protein
MNNDDGPDDWPDSALISEARRQAAATLLLLEHPKFQDGEGKSGLYETAHGCAQLILQLVQESQHCSGAEEFDVLLHLVCTQAEGLAQALSLLRIP